MGPQGLRLRIGIRRLGPIKTQQAPRKPLYLFFKESLGLVPKNAEGGGGVVQGEGEGNELSQRLRALQRRLRECKVTQKGQAGKVKREGVAAATTKLCGVFLPKDRDDAGFAEKPIGIDWGKVGSGLLVCDTKEVSPDM
ncbi:hypothetical protein MLD38_021964 [Melastoma candidum]|uniref:Uncharacterized protein n=1 Tax=Melastoma candidum TaxID=119954 RepID=A0ACB9QIX7_9MYRT|nr:hypothetical protein MLD38_021964 [Melastoma candidum]